MLSTVLVVIREIVPLLLVLLVLACALVGWALLRSERARAGRAAAALTALAGVTALVLTLYPDTSVRYSFCTVHFVAPVIGSIDGLANVFLLFPLAFFAVVLTRRPVPVALAASGFSALIELTQALLPALQRSCDTSDWQMNTIGAVLGAALAWWVGVLAERAPRPLRHRGGGPDRLLRAGWILSAVLGVLLVAWALRPLVTTPARVLDACQEQPAGPATRLDGDYTVTAGTSGNLCFRDPAGSSAYTDDIEYGPQSDDGTWETGIEEPGTTRATDSTGEPVVLHPVAGSDLLVWSARQR